MTDQRLTLSPDQIGDLGHALLTLAQEVAVLADRLCVVERVLEAQGLPGPKEIDAYQPDEQTASDLDARTQALVNRVVGALAGIAPSNPHDE
jgi:hypothetical protein